MQHETEQLFTTLESLVEGLTSGGPGIGSEGDYPFHPLVWDTSKQGEFSFIELLKSSGLLIEIELDELIDWHQVKLSQRLEQDQLPPQVSKYQSLIETLRSQLTLQAYKIQTYSKEPGDIGNDGFRGYDRFGFLIGKTTDGDRMGFSQLLPSPDRAGFGERLPKQDYSPSQAALDLENQLKPILKDEPSIVWEASVNLNLTIEALLRSAGLLEIWHFRGFCDEVDDSYPYINFEEFVVSHLKEPQIYVLGDGALYRLYVIGKCQTGDWLGASTLAVWT